MNRSYVVNNLLPCGPHLVSQIFVPHSRTCSLEGQHKVLLADHRLGV
jgi:hypothetical protein